MTTSWMCMAKSPFLGKLLICAETVTWFPVVVKVTNPLIEELSDVPCK